MAKEKALVFGGSSGLGYEIALGLKTAGYDVAVVGRHQRSHEFEFFPIDLRSIGYLGPRLDMMLIEALPCSLLVYAPGFYQEGLISDLKDFQIENMIHVGLTAPAMIMSRLLTMQDSLDGFIAITSTSQWTPRKKEPVYTAVKAGLGMFARSLAEDERIGKVLVAGPAGMKTNFWKGTDKDTSDMLDPKWVAEKILTAYSGVFNYKFIKLHRNPPRFELAENIVRDSK